MLRVIRVVCAVAAVLPAAQAVAGITHGGVVTPTQYRSYQPPARGGSYVDPAFGTTIKRLSNAFITPDAANGGTLPWILNEYSTPSLWNSPSTYLLLNHGSYFAVYDAAGNYLKDAPLDMAASTEPRWSRTDPNVVYYKRGNSLKYYNVATGGFGVVRTFSEYGGISGRGESDISFDGDHMVIVGDNRDVFVYTISTNQKGPAFNTGGTGFDSVYIAADNTVTITWLGTGTGRYRGIELFDKNMNFLRQVARSGGHMDMAKDVDGTPVLVWTNSNDPAPICNNGIVKIRLTDGQQTCLVELDWSLAVHISGSDNGWAVVSTYAPGDPNPSGFWPAYTQEVFRVRLDRSVIDRVAHHRSLPLNSYNYMPKASINRDGSRITFSSNFGMGGSSEYGDVYMMSFGGGPIPTTPPTATPTPPAPTPTPTPGTRIEQTHGSVVWSGAWTTQPKDVHSGGSAAYTKVAGAEATVWFTGTGIVWRGTRDPWAGQAQVYLDGSLRATVDTYSADELNGQALYTVTGLANGSHNLKIRVLGTKSPASGEELVWVDAFDIIGGAPAPPGATPTPAPTPTSAPAPTAPPSATATPTPRPGTTTKIEQNDPAVSYAGSWTTQAKAVHSGGSATYTGAAGAEVTVSFNGTAIVWRGTRDPWAGEAQVYVDGVLKATVDTYSAAETNQDVLYAATGLAAGAHTFKIRVLGSRNPNAGEPLVWVDSFDITGTPSAPNATPTPGPTPPSGGSVVWRNLVQASAAGGTLTKTGANSAYDSGAISTQSIGAGDGYVEFVAAGFGYRTVGLGTGDTNQHYTDVDFAIFTRTDGSYNIMERGAVLSAGGGAYASGDVFRVEVVGGVVRYRRNGALLYTSGLAPSYPLVVDTALYTPGVQVVDARMGSGSGTPTPPQPTATPAPTAAPRATPMPTPPPTDTRVTVTWTNLVQAWASAGTLTKSGGNEAYDSGAVSAQSIAAGDGYLEFTTPALGYRTVGLGVGDTSQHYSDVDFAIFTRPDGSFNVMEKGRALSAGGSYAAGDLFRIELVAGVVRYSRNGALVFTSTQAVAYPLVVDTALYSPGVQIGNAHLGVPSAGTPAPTPTPTPRPTATPNPGTGPTPVGVAWVNLIRAAAWSGTLVKTGGDDAYDAGAVSAQSIPSGDGYVEFTAAGFGYRTVGLGTGDTNQHYSDVDFAIFTRTDGSYNIMERGVALSAGGGTYASGDVFRVEVVGGAVRYRRNGTLLYTSSLAPSYPLVVDTALYTPGVQIGDAKIAQ